MEHFHDTPRSFGDDDDSCAFPGFCYSNETRLFFPKIEDKWHTYAYPYATATFKELLCLLRRGGSVGTFIYAHYAIASLLIKAVLEKRYTNVCICFSNSQSRYEFRKKLKMAVDAYHQTIGRVESSSELKQIGDLLVVDFKKELLHLSNGFVCEFVSMELERELRGFSFPDAKQGFVIMETDECPKPFLDHVLTLFVIHKPKSCIIGIESRLFYKPSGEDEARRVRRQLGHGNRTLKAGILSFDDSEHFTTCDVGCRSCKFATETWDDEIANFKSRLFPWTQESPVVVLAEQKNQQ